jgi:hypothetical protein
MDVPPPTGSDLAIPVKVLRYAQYIVDRYDSNGDAQLVQEEWSRMSGSPQEADLNADGVITVEEFARRTAEYSSGRKIRLVPLLSAESIRLPPLLGPSLGGRSTAAAAKVAQGASRAVPETESKVGRDGEAATGKPNSAYRRYNVPKSKLPKGLPDWFFARDTDGDAQLTLSEFAPQATPSAIREFTRYDRNRDGVVTAWEFAGTSRTVVPPPKTPR